MRLPTGAIWALCITAAFSPHAQANHEKPYIMQKDWVTIKGSEYTDGEKLYRRFAVTDDPQQALANLLVFHCDLKSSQSLGYYSLQLPRNFKTDAPEGPVPFETQVNVKGRSVTVSGEYKDRAYFIALNQASAPALGLVLEADSVTLGDFSFGFTQKGSAAVYAAAKELGAPLSARRGLSSSEMLRDCAAERSKKQPKS
jgi:hypothetical protein